jgi:hypothetical protein
MKRKIDACIICLVFARSFITVGIYSTGLFIIHIKNVVSTRDPTPDGREEGSKREQAEPSVSS